MLTIEDKNQMLIFKNHTHWALRFVFIFFGLFPLLVPYELLIKPQWHDFNWLLVLLFIFSFFACALSLLILFFAFTEHTSVTSLFDFNKQQFIYTATHSPLRKNEALVFSFSQIKQITISKHKWSDGPDSHSLEVHILNPEKKIQLASFENPKAAEEYAKRITGYLKGKD